MPKVTVTTIPTLLLPVNTKRKTAIFQNNGKEEIYVKRWVPNTPQPVPNVTNYDFILCPDKEEGNLCGHIEQIESIAAFVAVTGKGTADAAASETIKVVL